MVVFSTLMQQLCFWNLTMRVLIKIIKLDSLSIHSMWFIRDFNLLATANYCNSVFLWSFVDQDISKVGELVGHTSQVTAIERLIDSPLLITWDDLGVIKSWDIRTGQWNQTFIQDWKIIVKYFVNINDESFLWVSKRCHWFKYVESAAQK